MNKARLGPLLARTLEELGKATSKRSRAAIAARRSLADSEKIPVLVEFDPLPLGVEESWPEYSQRVGERLAPLCTALEDLTQQSPQSLLASNCICVQLTPAQIEEIRFWAEIEGLELDLEARALRLDEAALDLGLGLLTSRHPNLDGRGVSVAVLDSGIDTGHPYLHVADGDSVSTCGEGLHVAGDHATHVASILASRNEVFRGIAPGVRLLNIKVAQANGLIRPSWVAKGIDVALTRGANVLSLSLGYDHFPDWFDHKADSWPCSNGSCRLCTAVDGAAGAVVVVAAGNEHGRALQLQQDYPTADLDTELTCPGQARRAMTVGAFRKGTGDIWTESSRGPTADGRAKPDLAAPGVNILAAVPRTQAGSAPLARRSGTSMAAPLVAGAAALLIQQRLESGRGWTPEFIRKELLERAVLPGGDPRAFGAGRLELGGL